MRFRVQLRQDKVSGVPSLKIPKEATRPVKHKNPPSYCPKTCL